MAEVDRAFGAQGVHLLEGLPEDLLVKEENGMESLILGAGRQLTVTGQVGEELFDL